MKKKNLKSLKLNKVEVSNLKSIEEIKGGISNAVKSFCNNYCNSFEVTCPLICTI